MKSLSLMSNKHNYYSQTDLPALDGLIFNIMSGSSNACCSRMESSITMSDVSIRNQQFVKLNITIVVVMIGTL